MLDRPRKSCVAVTHSDSDLGQGDEVLDHDNSLSTRENDSQYQTQG